MSTATRSWTMSTILLYDKTCRLHIHWLILPPMNFCDSAHNSSMIACFNCSTFSKFLPWYKRSCRVPEWNGIIHRLLGGHMSGSIKVTFWCSGYEMVFRALCTDVPSCCRVHLLYPTADLVQALNCSNSHCSLWCLAPWTRYWFSNL